MITIISAGYRHGYSGRDHLITGRECDDVVGREYRSVRDARLAAERVAEQEKDECGGRVRWWAPVEIEVRYADGHTRCHS